MTAKRTVFFIVRSFPPDYSGAGDFIRRLGQGLAEKGYNITILTRNSGKKLITPRLDNKVSIFSFGSIASRYFVSVNISLMYSLFLLLHAKRKDVLCFVSFFSENILPIIVAKLRGMKIVMRQTIANNPYIPSDDCMAISEMSLGRIWLFFLKKMVDSIIAVSPAILENNKGYGIPEHKFELIPNFPSTFIASTSPKKNKSNDSTGKSKQILFVGVLCKRKGVDIILNAWEKIQQQFVDATLVLVGPTSPPPSEVDLQIVKRAQEMIESGYNIKLEGYQENIVQYFEQADLFIFPSRMEGFPNAIVEAMAAGIPVVTAEIKGITDFIFKKDSGIIVPQNNPNQLAEAVISILNNPAMTSELVRNAKQSYKQYFSENVIIPKYLEVFSE